MEQGRKKRKQATFREHCHYILLSDQGKSVDQIADSYQVRRQTITNWFNRYELAGTTGLHTAEGKGRPPIIRIDNQSEVKRVEDLVESNAKNLNPVLVKIEEEFGKKMSKRTLQRLLKKGWIWKRFRKEPPKKPDLQELVVKTETLTVLIGLFLLGYIDLRYADETAFNLEPNIPYGWIKKGEQKAIPSGKGGNLNVFGLLNLKGELTTYQTTSSVNANQVIEWFDDFANAIK